MDSAAGVTMCVDDDGLFDTAPTLSNIVTTVTHRHAQQNTARYYKLREEW
ncbi:MAG: hypothetical protein ILA17_08920 [Ruminococcus sp.]|nr:hypothetical protein [Ruminiclostridium sp.]MBP1537977.1 hypothetical protein [Ruminococcus sp.]